MKNQYNLERNRAERISKAAHASVTALAKNPRLLFQLQAGLGAEREGFAAFILVRGVAKLPPEELHDVFHDAFRTSSANHEFSILDLVDDLDGNGELDGSGKESRITDPLTGVSESLQEALEQRFEFIVTDDGCFVFDRAFVPGSRS